MVSVEIPTASAADIHVDDRSVQPSSGDCLPISGRQDVRAHRRSLQTT